MVFIKNEPKTAPKKKKKLTKTTTLIKADKKDNDESESNVLTPSITKERQREIKRAASGHNEKLPTYKHFNKKKNKAFPHNKQQQANKENLNAVNV